MLRNITVLGFLFVLSGCAFYNVGAILEKGGKPIFGTATVAMGGFGTLDAKSEDGSIVCTGSTAVTKQPAFTKVGAQGYADGKCNDGRTFKIDFIQTTESGGHGKGVDNDGNVVIMHFDSSETLVKSRMRSEQLRRLTN